MFLARKRSIQVLTAEGENWAREKNGRMREILDNRRNGKTEKYKNGQMEERRSMNIFFDYFSFQGLYIMIFVKRLSETDRSN